MIAPKVPVAMANTKPMAGGHRASRKNSKGLFGRVWAPGAHTLEFAGETLSNLGRTATKVVGNTVSAVGRVGTRAATHANRAFRNVISRRRRNSRRASRRSSRR